MDGIYKRTWAPAGEPQAFVLLVHGYAEHCGRYGAIAGRLAAAGLQVDAFDLPGHGRSGGRRGYIHSFEKLVDTLKLQLVAARNRAGDRPLFLLAHSMGGLVAVHALIRQPDGLRGAVLSSPLLAVPEDVPAWKLWASDWLGRYLPGFPVERLESTAIARDPAVVAAYRADPLVYHGALKARTGLELLRAIRQATAHFSQIKLPLLVLHGTGDRIAPFSGSERIYREAGSKDRTCYWEQGGYHELLNDVNRAAAEDAILHWIRERIPPQGREGAE